MDFASIVESVRAGQVAGFTELANDLAFAQALDAQDPVRELRLEYIYPTKSSLKKSSLDGKLPREHVDLQPKAHGGPESKDSPDKGSKDEPEGNTSHGSSPAIYFNGNSLGLQPKAVRQYLNAQLETWASIGVYGHYLNLENSPLVNWQDMAEQCAKQSANIVGASPDEIVIMNSLTTNLHFLLASFYRPTEKRHKIILEWKPFPSDYYAIESHLRWHGLDPTASMVEIDPDDDFYISTAKTLATIDAHADDAALLLLPGIQYYSGQLFDMAAITAHAQARGLVVGWDLAHAVGNAELRLHDWNVDFAAWCTYKYLNAGPGAVAGAFVHARHGTVELRSSSSSSAEVGSDGDGRRHVFRPRLAGWYGGDKSVRFNMAKEFQPTPGAAGFQISNPSAIDLASLSGALSVFGKTEMRVLRDKSLALTAYAEWLLDGILKDERRTQGAGNEPPAFRFITPRNPAERGAQLSLLLRPGMLDTVGAALKESGVVCDQRKPDVVRVSPVPMYNSFEEVWRCISVLRRAILG